MEQVIRIGRENPTEFRLDFERVGTAWKDGHWHLWILSCPFKSLESEDKVSMDEVEDAIDHPLLMLIFGESYEDMIERQRDQSGTSS